MVETEIEIKSARGRPGQVSGLFTKGVKHDGRAPSKRLKRRACDRERREEGRVDRYHMVRHINFKIPESRSRTPNTTWGAPGPHWCLDRGLGAFDF